MEVNVIRENRTELEVEIVGEGHTLCDALRSVLSADENVLIASYKIEHPLLSNPILYIKTKDIAVPKTKRKIVPLDGVKGIGPMTLKTLRKAGVKSANALLKANPEKLAKKSGLSANMIRKYIDAAKKLDFGGESAPRFLLKNSLKKLDKMVSSIRVKGAN